MKLKTKFFGEMHISGQEVIRFPLGLPGFEGLNDFVCIQEPGMQPLVFVQSVQQPQVCFITMPAETLLRDYQLNLSEEDADILEIRHDQGSRSSDLSCMAMLIAQPGQEPAANLLAPLVINREKHVALQSIQYGSCYSHHHVLTAGEQSPLSC